MRVSQLTSISLVTLLVANIYLTRAAATISIQEHSLMAGFRNPPKLAKPSAYWLWLNGYLNRDHLEEELKQFSEMGIGGLCIFDMGARGRQDAAPPAGAPFMSDESVDTIAYVIRTAAKYNLDVQLATSSSWDMGGSWVKPKHASMKLYWTETSVEGPETYDRVLPFPKLPTNVPKNPDGTPAFFRKVAALAIPGVRQAGVAPVIDDLESLVNLTDRVDADGKLTWNVPAGQWTVLRFICANTGERLKVPSPNSNGLATDHFNAEATRVYIQYLIDRLEEKLGDLRDSGLKQLYLPSFEVKDATWTPDFVDQFRRYRSYDMVPYLPMLAGYLIENEKTAERFQYDYRKTLGDLLVDAYYRTASETAQRAGLGIEAEAGGPGPPVHQVPVDALKALGAIDEMRGEFWPFRMERDSVWVVKETASAAHVYGRQRVHMEAFTGFRHWQDGPFELKPSADRAFCEGMNHVVWHTASHQPPESGKPGWVYHAGSHLNPNLVWWPQAKPFLDYLSRCSFLLQQGLFVGDVCYYYGDQGFNFVPPKHIDPSLGFGFDYDVANPEVILTRMTVDNGKIALPDGMQYELLVLPERDDMDLQVLQRIEELVRAGATVVGPKPIRSNGLSDYAKRDVAVRNLADRLWGFCDGETIHENSYGKGTIRWGRSLKDILQSRGVGPDFQFLSNRNDTDLDYIHRRTEQVDIYFVSNKKARWEEVTAQFRISGKTPELWLPDSGEIIHAILFKQTEQGTELPLKLAPNGSLFVVFRKSADKTHLTSVETQVPQKPTLTLDYSISSIDSASQNIQFTAFQNGTYLLKDSNDRSTEVSIRDIPSPQEITGSWQVHFEPGWGAPGSISLDSLKSWTRHGNPGIRYFSGTARYEKTIRIPPEWINEGKRVFLDLGTLWAVGEVRLNSQPQGIVWKPPYRLDITESAKAGNNLLEIDVANTWSNRLVGDALSPGEKPYSRTNIERSGTPGLPWKHVSLNESGLLGPVRLIPAETKTVSLVFNAEMIEFELSGARAFIVTPRRARPDGTKPWVWYAPSLTSSEGGWTLPSSWHAAVVTGLLDRGFYFCGVDVGESYGSPAGRATYTAFYQRLVDHFGISSKPCLFPVGRGGLMHYNWAAEHPEFVQCIGAIYPVCNLSSYPKLERASSEYGLSPDQLPSEWHNHNR